MRRACHPSISAGLALRCLSLLAAQRVCSRVRARRVRRVQLPRSCSSARRHLARHLLCQMLASPSSSLNGLQETGRLLCLRAVIAWTESLAGISSLANLCRQRRSLSLFRCVHSDGDKLCAGSDLVGSCFVFSRSHYDQGLARKVENLTSVMYAFF